MQKLNKDELQLLMAWMENQEIGRLASASKVMNQKVSNHLVYQDRFFRDQRQQAANKITSQLNYLGFNPEQSADEKLFHEFDTDGDLRQSLAKLQQLYLQILEDKVSAEVVNQGLKACLKGNLGEDNTLAPLQFIANQIQMISQRNFAERQVFMGDLRRLIAAFILGTSLQAKMQEPNFPHSPDRIEELSEILENVSEIKTGLATRGIEWAKHLISQFMLLIFLPLMASTPITYALGTSAAREAVCLTIATALTGAAGYQHYQHHCQMRKIDTLIESDENTIADHRVCG